MAAPMLEQFPKGKLNNCWHYIELCKFVHPELTETIDRLRDTLIRYTLVKPWPLPPDGGPECFLVRFLTKEQNDFFFYYGLGYGFEARMSEEELPTEHFDLEKAIIDCRLDYVRLGKVYQNGAW